MGTTVIRLDYLFQVGISWHSHMRLCALVSVLNESIREGRITRAALSVAPSKRIKR
jgi:hypothetical protein